MEMTNSPMVYLPRFAPGGVLYLRTPTFISGQVLGCSFNSSYRLLFILSLFSFASPGDAG